MNKFVFAAVFLASCTAFAVQPSKAVIDAIAFVESSNRADAIGDNGRAIGKFQLHREYVADVNRFAKTNYQWKDAFDPVKAEQIVRLYLDHYTKGPVDNETFARIHNGGPRGHKKACTKKYWKKVEKAMADRRTAKR